MNRLNKVIHAICSPDKMIILAALVILFVVVTRDDEPTRMRTGAGTPHRPGSEASSGRSGTPHTCELGDKCSQSPRYQPGPLVKGILESDSDEIDDSPSARRADMESRGFREDGSLIPR